jgi:type IV secretory pathway VirB10-like protein
MQADARTDQTDFYLTPLNRALMPSVWLRVQVERNTLLAIVFSLLVHGLILFLALPQLNLDSAAMPPTTIQVSLAPPPAEPPPPPVELPKPPKKPKPVSRPKVMTQKPSAQPSDFNLPEAAPSPAPSAPVAPAKDQPVDMMAYVNAKRQQRLAMENDAAKQNAEAVAKEQGPSAEQVREQRIKDNLKVGTNGIFEITSLSARHAGFSFRGWTNDYSNARREAFEVEAGVGQDIRLLVVKKMIVLIRQHYQGDFNWESQRLGRVVIQSARPEDNAGLEDFMMMEFFGTYYKNKR